MDLILGGKWFCSAECKASKTKEINTVVEDFKFNYVRAFTCMGLMDLVRRDAVRENDGKAMMSHWRMDMLLFLNNHHPKYSLLGHRLLAGMSCKCDH